jgi:hypothetical protein
VSYDSFPIPEIRVFQMRMRAEPTLSFFFAVTRDAAIDERRIFKVKLENDNTPTPDHMPA